MTDPQKPDGQTERDQVEQVLRQCGVNTADMERLARIVSNMQHIEWELARRANAIKAAVITGESS